MSPHKRGCLGVNPDLSPGRKQDFRLKDAVPSSVGFVWPEAKGLKKECSKETNLGLMCFDLGSASSSCLLVFGDGVEKENSTGRESRQEINII